MKHRTYRTRKQRIRERNNLRFGIAILVGFFILVTVGWIKQTFYQPTELISPIPTEKTEKKADSLHIHVEAAEASPTPTPTPDPLVGVSADMPLEEAIKLPEEVVRAYMSKKFASEAANAKEVQRCENGRFIYTLSRGNKNGSVDTGLFQINSIHRKKIEAMYGIPYEVAMIHPIKNIDFTHRLMTEQGGWGAWYSSVHCHGVN